MFVLCTGKVVQHWWLFVIFPTIMSCILLWPQLACLFITDSVMLELSSQKIECLRRCVHSVCEIIFFLYVCDPQLTSLFLSSLFWQSLQLVVAGFTFQETSPPTHFSPQWGDFLGEFEAAPVSWKSGPFYKFLGESKGLYCFN